VEAQHEAKRERKMVGSECLSNPPILNASAGVGYLTNIAGVNSYVSGSPLAILTIVLISDIFGIPSSFFYNIFILCFYNVIQVSNL